jgi:hypothetical protein
MESRAVGGKIKVVILELSYPGVLLSSTGEQGGSTMRYKPRGLTALQVALGGLPDAMRVETDKDIGVSAKTVGELRKIPAWPENLVITTPQDRYPGSAIKVTKASIATRVFPKP